MGSFTILVSVLFVSSVVFVNADSYFDKYNRIMGKVEKYVRASSNDLVRAIRSRDESVEVLNDHMNRMRHDVKNALSHAHIARNALRAWEDEAQDLSSHLGAQKAKLLLQISNNKKVNANLLAALGEIKANTEDAAYDDITSSEGVEYLRGLCEKFLAGNKFLYKQLLSKDDKNRLDSECA